VEKEKQAEMEKFEGSINDADKLRIFKEEMDNLYAAKAEELIQQTAEQKQKTRENELIEEQALMDSIDALGRSSSNKEQKRLDYK